MAIHCRAVKNSLRGTITNSRFIINSKSASNSREASNKDVENIAYKKL
jgi:hypothetical protein